MGPFIFDLILGTLLHGARTEEGERMETFQSPSLVLQGQGDIMRIHKVTRACTPSPQGQHRVK